MKLSKLVLALSSVFALINTGNVHAAKPPEGFTQKEQAPDFNLIINSDEYQNAWPIIQNSWHTKPGKDITLVKNKFVFGQTLTASFPTQQITFYNNGYIIKNVINGVEVHLDGVHLLGGINEGVKGMVAIGIGNTVQGTRENLGSLTLNWGAKSYDTVVNEYGVLKQNYKSEAYNTLVNKGGLHLLNHSSYAQANKIDGGTQEFSKSAWYAIAEDTLIINGGQQIIHNGTAKNTHIGEGSHQLSSGLGLAEDTYVYSGGYQLIDKASGDRIGAKNTTIYEGGTQRIQSGEAHGNQVYGQQIISSERGEWQNGQWIAQDGTVLDTAPASIDSTIQQQGIQIVEYDGSAHSTIINGGRQQVNERGNITNTTIQNNGLTTLAYGAFSRGDLNVESGSLTMVGGGLHAWTDANNPGKKGAYAENVHLKGEGALYLKHNGQTPESIVTIDNLSNEGRVLFGQQDGLNSGQYSQLDINHLAGLGLFVMNTNINDGQGDFLNVQESIDGHFDVKVMDSGSEPVHEGDHHLIFAKNSQKDSFSLVNGSVDLGAYKYYLNQGEGNSDNWYLSPTAGTLDRDPSDGAKSALVLANVTPAIWDSELSTLRVRMGELRQGNTSQNGAWGKVISSRHRIKGNAPYEQDMSGVMIGGDHALAVDGGTLHLGGLFSYNHSKLDASNSDGKVDSYALGAYATLLKDNGYYIDGVLKANRFRTENSARFNDGKAKAKDNSSGLGLSIEFGKHITQDDFFIEPYVLASAFYGQKTDYQFDSGLKVKADAAESIKAEVGTTLGKSFTTQKGALIKPYLRLAVSHEFKRDSDVLINDKAQFNTDLSGTVGKYGIGVTAQMNQQWSAYGEFNYAKGSKQETPYSGSVGVRYQF